MSDQLKGYLPPEGPPNVHGVRYTYRENQGAHSVGDTLVHSPEEIILTRDEFAQRECERYGLEAVDSDVAEAALDAHLDGEDVAAQLEDAQSDDESPTCAEGDCSRTVSDEGDFCWQHPLDEDDDGQEG